jgi:uracil-DNA glycosylase
MNYDDDSFSCYLSSKDELVGTVSVNFNYIANLFVLEEHRRQGYGSILLKQAEEIVRGKGYTECILDVSPNGIEYTDLVSFYEKNKYKSFSSLRFFHKLETIDQVELKPEMEYITIVLDDTEVEDIETLPSMDGLTIYQQAKLYPPKGWIGVFQDTKNSMKNISSKLRERGRFYPCPATLLFHVFRICPLLRVKVVIIGQDPYPDPRNAYGIAFSTPPGGKIPPSLNTIYKELASEYNDFVAPKDGCLLPWVEQGVFLLNSCLTYHPDNKLERGNLSVWMPFVTKVIDAICTTNPDAVFVLWGEKAQLLESRIKSCKIIKGVHPSPRAHGFLGCNHFREINEHLVKTQQIPVDWRL